MRLINADDLYKRYCELYENTVSDCEVDRLAYMISSQPTAYDAPPLKIGDTAWAIRTYKGVKYAQKGIVNEMFYNKDMKLVIVVKNIARGLFGEKVFATKEEAEQALKQMGEVEAWQRLKQ